MKEKRKLKIGRVIIALIVLALIVSLSWFLITKFFFKEKIKLESRFLASSSFVVKLYDEEGIEKKEVARGKKVNYHLDKFILVGEEKLHKIFIDDEIYYIKDENMVTTEEEIVKESEVFVRTSLSIYESDSSTHLLGLAKKNEKLDIVGYNKLNNDGTVDMYKIKQGEIVGYIYPKYIVYTREEAALQYDPEKYYEVHEKRGNSYGGGSAGNLDYYPVNKPKFEDNVMPDAVYALYLNGGSDVIGNIDNYIAFAKTTKINSFVVDIKDNEASAYKSSVMEKYSPTNYEKGINSFEDYKNAIKKLKDEGFYVIGRITVFKDKFYANDHPENTIMDTRTNKPFLYTNTYWPSAFNRDVWEFNVELAKEAVSEMGFNEIQFDYVRFPDRTSSYEKAGTMDFKNTYGEDKAEAIQRFLMYATDELHKLNVYVSADVFGESAHTYVTAYGQYWAAISNVVDVISAMPYPDHFGNNEYGFTTPPYKKPYEIMNHWGKNYAAKRQEECPTPAVVRTWIQAYDALPGDFPYNAKEVESEIRGLFDAGLTGGYMTWNSGSNLNKYKIQAAAYQKEYK